MRIRLYILWFILVVIVSFCLGLGSRQSIYDKGLYDGKKYQLIQDEYLYEKCGLR